MCSLGTQMTLTTTISPLLRDESQWTPSIHSNVVDRVAVSAATAARLERWRQQDILATWGPAKPPVHTCALPPVARHQETSILSWRDSYNTSK